MKTPFDTVLRMRRREIDQTRIAIHAESTRLLEIDRESQAIEQELAHEYRVSAESWAASAEAFIRRRMSQQAQLMVERVAVSERIEGLRREAIDAYASRHVLESAVEVFHAEHRRQVTRAEQREADDLRPARIPSRVQARTAPPTHQASMR